MKWIICTRRWSILVLATLLLVLSLAVAACGQASQQGSSNSSGSYSTSQQSTSQQGTSQQSTSQDDNNTLIQNADQDVQGQLQSLDKTQNDVMNSGSTQDDGQMP